MKNIRKLLTSVLAVLALSVIIAGFGSSEAQAATKTVKNIKYSSTLTNKIKKYASVVKRGTTTLNVKKQGYLKFKAPSTKKFSFTFYGMTGSTYTHNNGFAYILAPTKYSYDNKYHFDHLKFSTTGGKTTTAWFHTKYLADTDKTVYAFLAKRTCKLKLKKGQTVYLYVSFANKGKIKLQIK